MTKNKLAFVSGATSGIGEATAEILAANQWNLIISGRRLDRLNKLASSLKTKYNVEVRTVCFDIQQREKVKDSLASCANLLTKIDLLVNNAGLALGKSPFKEDNFKITSSDKSNKG
jgi:NADP-dependent 3-hydroxy acid dehydrogenase YdfG